MRILQLVITPTDVAQGGLGFAAVSNLYWYDYLNSAIQTWVGLGGCVLVYYTIRKVRSEWLLNRSKLKREKSDDVG